MTKAVRLQTQLACCSALVLLLSLAGCGDSTTEGNDDADSGDSHEEDATVSMQEDSSTPVEVDAGMEPTDAGAPEKDASIPDEDAGRDAAVADVSVCGDGKVTGDETCDTMKDPCCNSTCTGIAAKDTVCRPADGACDVADVCDGKKLTCGKDAVAVNTVECRASVGDCDQPEMCDGTTKLCPKDVARANRTECRASTGGCDAAEFCDGTHNDCPVDTIAEVGTVCREAVSDCDVAETCDGTGACPVDVIVTDTTVVCRAAAGECDLAETCNGTEATCPTDAFRAEGNGCGDQTDCAIKTCNASGACVAKGDAVDGAPCEDGVLCVGGDHCEAGVCMAGTLVGDQLFADDFSPGAAWLLDGDWDIGTTLMSVGCDEALKTEDFSQDPPLDHSDGNDNQIGGVGLGDCVEPSVHPNYCMTSPVIATDGATGGVSLNFWRWLNADYIALGEPYMISSVDVTMNGTAWTTIWESDDQAVNDASWIPQSFDVSAFKSATFQLRFCYRTETPGFYYTSGWNVDDVSVCEDAACAPGMLAADGGGCRFPVSCKELHDAASTLPSGIYGINPDDFAHAEPFPAYCDMTTDGGGWTLTFNDAAANFDADESGESDETGFDSNGTNLSFSQLAVEADMMIDAKDGDIVGENQDVRSIVHGVDASVATRTVRDLLVGRKRYLEADDNSNLVNTFQNAATCASWGEYGDTICGSQVLTFGDRSDCDNSVFFDIGASMSRADALDNCAGWPQAPNPAASNEYPDNFRIWIR